ncbi:MAG TPA: L-threonylcarbamoyladenylate synthase [Chitinispirillaceae bacterium]|nr:L-threonylcarbamoyladenylate synthase [Chitinispirillaceae bacterium]
MKAERITLHSALDKKKHLDYICHLIKSESVFVYPTDTIYGIGGRTDSDNVKSRILEIKGRFSGNPMILIASDLKYFKHYNIRFSSIALKIADLFWPGLLTLVLQSDLNPQGVAIRISDHPFIKAVNTITGTPLFSTSANISNEKYNPDPDFIYKTFSDSVDFMIDAGLLPLSEPSTVIKISESDEITILREGVVSREKLESVMDL